MRIFELVKKDKKIYYHGSNIKLPVGTILTGRGHIYDDNWGDTDFYNILEKYRPKDMIAHRDAVFMVDNDNDLDVVGGGTEYVFILEPLDKIEKHDINWSSEISMLISEGYGSNDDLIKKAAKNYWLGIPHPNESVWEFLTKKARIIDVEDF